MLATARNSAGGAYPNDIIEITLLNPDRMVVVAAKNGNKNAVAALHLCITTSPPNPRLDIGLFPSLPGEGGSSTGFPEEEDRHLRLLQSHFPFKQQHTQDWLTFELTGNLSKRHPPISELPERLPKIDFSVFGANRSVQKAFFDELLAIQGALVTGGLAGKKNAAEMKAVLERYNFGGSVTNAFLQLNGQPQHIEVVTVNRKNGTISVALKVPEPRYEEFPSSAQGISFLVKSDKNELDIIQICVAPNTASIERDMKELRLPTGNSTGSHHREFFGSEAYEIFAWMRSNQEVGNAREDVLGRLNAPQIFGDHAAEFLQIAKEVMQMSPKLIALSGNMRRTLLIQYETRLQALATGRNHSAVTPGA